MAVPFMQENASSVPPMHDASISVHESPLPTRAVALPDQRVHEIGLISVGVNAEQRYVGPSSGIFLARLLLSCSPRQHDRREPVDHNSTNLAQSLVDQLVQATPGPLPLPTKTQSVQLARIYFDTVHPQYPILHEPSFMRTLDSLYESNAHLENDVAFFQVNMVLAIASSILSSRARSHIPGESYCLSALHRLERLNVQSSFSGLQCALLLLVFTMHNPCIRLNVWYLNYHCIAAVLDLGLQRDITTSSGISLLDQEMRTRVFWTVFTLDRTIATMMGRPIGLRDEACELRVRSCKLAAYGERQTDRLLPVTSRSGRSCIGWNTRLNRAVYWYHRFVYSPLQIGQDQLRNQIRCKQYRTGCAYVRLSTGH